MLIFLPEINFLLWVLDETTPSTNSLGCRVGGTGFFASWQICRVYEEVTLVTFHVNNGARLAQDFKCICLCPFGALVTY